MYLGIGFDNIDRGGLGKDIFGVKGLGVNEFNWGNIWKKRIDRNAKQKAVSLWERVMEGNPLLSDINTNQIRGESCFMMGVGKGNYSSRLEQTSWRLMIVVAVVVG